VIRKESRSAGDQLAIDADAEIHPVAHEVAIVVGRLHRIREMGVTLVVAATRADVADAAGGAALVGAIRPVFDETGELLLFDAAVDRAIGLHVGSGEPMAEIETALVINRQHAEPCPARQCL